MANEPQTNIMGGSMSNFNVIEYVDNQKEFFAPVLSDDSITWEKEKQFAIQAFQGNKFLTDTAAKNPASLQNAIINVASIGISLNPANKHAYLVPRDGKVCLDISYMGLLHLAMTSGSILWGQCKLVHESDTYTSNGLDKAPTHSYNPFGDRGKMIGGYCTVKTPQGDYLTDEMSLAEIVKIQNSSKAKNGPWKTHFNEMARKTIVKRGSKYWPTVDRLDNAIHHLNTDGGEGLTEKDITPELITTEQAGQLLSLLCDDDGIYTVKGEKVARAFKFNNLGEIKSADFEKVLQVAS